jgi:hypothetical protein
MRWSAAANWPAPRCADSGPGCPARSASWRPPRFPSSAVHGSPPEPVGSASRGGPSARRRSCRCDPHRPARSRPGHRLRSCWPAGCSSRAAAGCCAGRSGRTAAQDDGADRDRDGDDGRQAAGGLELRHRCLGQLAAERDGLVDTGPVLQVDRMHIRESLACRSRIARQQRVDDLRPRRRDELLSGFVLPPEQRTFESERRRLAPVVDALPVLGGPACRTASWSLRHPSNPRRPATGPAATRSGTAAAAGCRPPHPWRQRPRSSCVHPGLHPAALGGHQQRREHTDGAQQEYRDGGAGHWLAGGDGARRPGGYADGA